MMMMMMMTMTMMMMMTFMMIDWIAPIQEVVPCQSIKVRSGQVDMYSQPLGELYAIRKAAADAVDSTYVIPIHTYIHTYMW